MVNKLTVSTLRKSYFYAIILYMKRPKKNYYNWSTDETALKKAGSGVFTKWKLEQQINYGLRGGNINKRQLLKYWDQLSLDPLKKNYFEFLLWGKLPIASSQKSNKTSWKISPG